MEVKERNMWVDIARGIAIILVVLGHLSAPMVAKGVKQSIYYFHMPLFFLLSGYVMKVPSFKTFGTFVSFLEKKIRRLLVPYVIFACVFMDFSFVNLKRILYGSREMLVKAGSLVPLWFLPTLFVATIVTAVLLQFVNEKNRRMGYIILSVLCFGVGLLIKHPKFGFPLGCDIAFVASGFMLIGMVLKTLQPKTVDIVTIICFPVFVVMICCTAKWTGINMSKAVYGNRLMFLLRSLSGAFTVIGISKVFTKLPIIRSWCAYIGRNSMCVFLLHKPLKSYFFREFSIATFPIAFQAIALTSITIACCLIADGIITRVCPQLIGKN